MLFEGCTGQGREEANALATHLHRQEPGAGKAWAGEDGPEGVGGKAWADFDAQAETVDFATDQMTSELLASGLPNIVAQFQVKRPSNL